MFRSAGALGEFRGVFVSAGEDGTLAARIARHTPDAGANGICRQTAGRLDADGRTFVFLSPETDSM